ncbi:MAG TPA: DUF4268 domain-containing protein [Rhizomicrobium sp.]|nr:DUF4268 domain-containing protein [Rhizomicrobium sp.]
MAAVLGFLKYLKLRQVWPHEEQDFTPWLAKEENLAALSKELGLELQLEQIEVPVGPYFADILAKDASGRYVVIENQFNKTNHDHLGKLIAYSATLNASVVIWIAEQFTEEHQRAIEWLNERTVEDLSLFAVQPRVFQIDNSNPAVEFHVIERPNELVKSVAMALASGEVSGTRKTQLEFWTEFKKRLLEKKVLMSAQTPRPQYWFDVALGRSNINISNILNTADGKMGIRIYIHSAIADSALEQLMSQKSAIESEIGHQLQWNPNPSNRDKIIALSRDIDLENRNAWPEYIEWLVDMTAKFRAAFMPRAKALEISSQATGPQA